MFLSFSGAIFFILRFHIKWLKNIFFSLQHQNLTDILLNCQRLNAASTGELRANLETEEAAFG